MKNNRLIFLSFFTTILLAVAVQTQHQTAAPDIALLKKHVSYLASTELEGRKTGTKGADLAAEYIARHFQSLGLSCPTSDLKCLDKKGKPNIYFNEFPFVAAVELAKDNSLLFNQNGKDNVAKLNDDFLPIGYSSNGSAINSKAVFVGYGITASELNHDDYGAVDAKEKIAIAFAGTPDGDNMHGQFARFADSRWKAVAAKNHGAKALIVIARFERFRDDRLSRLSYDQTAGEAGLPVVAISRQLAVKLFGLSDISQLTEFEKSADKRAELAQSIAKSTYSLSVDIKRQTVTAYNVIGVLEGNDPKLKNEYIVIGAHYDHLGHGGESSRLPESNAVHHGADDNASGVAGLLELARIFTGERKQLRRSLVFMAFSGEESGLVGSHHYVNKPFVPNANTIAMINLDMIGRLRENKLTIGGLGTAQEFRKLIESSNAALDSARKFVLQLSDDGFGPSDHSSFYARQIPVLFFFTGTHEDYHKPSDTADKVNNEGQASIVSYIADLVRQVDRNDSRPSYTLAQSSGSRGRSTGFRVYLGTIPSYAESNDGLALDGVRDDSPASKAGIKAGDKIVKLAGRDIKNVYDYTYALGEMKPDQEYEVEVIRGGERLKLKMIPQTRK